MNSRPRGYAFWTAGERSTGAGTWYCQAKHHEARRKGRRESHLFIVPLKQGNLDRGDPGEGRERFVMDL